LKLAGKGAAGFLIALAVWLWLSAPYARLLASLSEGAIRLAERPAVTSITAQGTLMVIDRMDIHRSPASMQLAVESTDITFNFILLLTLFAASGRALSDRNVFGFIGAAIALVFVHVAAVVSFVKAEYALNMGAWSAAHYGLVARKFWGAAPYFYSVIGVYGFAFALWWLFRPASTTSPRTTSRAKSRHRRALPHSQPAMGSSPIRK
jgi:hypothetical protein